MALLCLSCAPTLPGALVPPGQPLQGHAESRLFHWQRRVVAFWSGWPTLFRLLRAAPLLLFAGAIFCAYLPGTREHAPLLLALAALLSVLAEAVPLVPLPLQRHNAVTSHAPRFAVALAVALFAVAAVALGGGVLLAAERWGNAVFFERSGFSAAPRSFWAASAAPWASAALLAAPLAFFAALSVLENFVAAADAAAPVLN
jgi:hypothetical protein